MFGDRPSATVEGRLRAERLLLDADALERATGWTLKPEGLCRAEACIPLPQDGSWQDQDGRVDVTAFARRAGRPIVHDDEHGIWAIGEPAEALDGTLASVQAPEFTLPDLDGGLHSLSDYRGQKIFLLAWGSY